MPFSERLGVGLYAIGQKNENLSSKITLSGYIPFSAYLGVGLYAIAQKNGKPI